MSGRYTTSRPLASRTLGEMLRELRLRKGVPLWKAAAAADMDSTLLCKLERGNRLPTDAQAAALARYFEVPLIQIEAALMAEKFLKDAAKNPGAAALALARIEEGAGEYHVSKRPTAANKPASSVNKPKKRN
jgi:transcriptional regulator with XRE-family HTH domain